MATLQSASVFANCHLCDREFVGRTVVVFIGQNNLALACTLNCPEVINQVGHQPKSLCSVASNVPFGPLMSSTDLTKTTTQA